MSLDQELARAMDLYQQQDYQALALCDLSVQATQKFVDTFFETGRIDEVYNFGLYERFNDPVIKKLIDAGMTEKLQYFTKYREESDETISSRATRFSKAFEEKDYASAARATLEAYGFIRNPEGTVQSLTRLCDEDANTVFDVCVGYEIDMIQKGMFAHDEKTQSLPQQFELTRLVMDYTVARGKDAAETNSHRRHRTFFEKMLEIVPPTSDDAMSISLQLAEINAVLKDSAGCQKAWERYQELSEQRYRATSEGYRKRISELLGKEIHDPVKLILPGDSGFDQILRQGTQNMDNHFSQDHSRPNPKEFSISSILERSKR